MATSDVKQLLALEAEGVDWSRNRNFELFEKDGPRRARRLKRNLAALGELIRERQSEPGFSLTVARDSGEFELCMHLDNPSTTVLIRMHADELRILCRHAEVAALLVAGGLPLDRL